MPFAKAAWQFPSVIPLQRGIAATEIPNSRHNGNNSQGQHPCTASSVPSEYGINTTGACRQAYQSAASSLPECDV